MWVSVVMLYAEMCDCGYGFVGYAVCGFAGRCVGCCGCGFGVLLWWVLVVGFGLWF